MYNFVACSVFREAADCKEEPHEGNKMKLIDKEDNADVPNVCEV